MITWYFFRIALTRITLFASLPSVTQDVLRARYSSLSLRGFIGGYEQKNGSTGYRHLPYGLALYLPRSTSIYPPHRSTSWIYAASEQGVTPDLPLGWMDYLTYSTPHYSLGSDFTPAIDSPASLIPTCSTTKHCELMVHPTANNPPRPRYVIVRKRAYVPPRDDLDSSDQFFEPVYENTEEKLQAQAFYKQFFGRYYSVPPVSEERLSSPCMFLALVNCISIVVCLAGSQKCRALVLSAITQGFKSTGTLALLNHLDVVVRLVHGYGCRALAWAMQSLFLQSAKVLATIDKLEYASLFLAVVFLDEIEEQVVESPDKGNDETQVPVLGPVPAGDMDSVEEIVSPTPGIMDADVDEIDEQLVESMITVESPDQDEELEHPERDLNETQTPVEELACALGIPMDLEDVEEIEEQAVEAMVVVEEPNQEEEPMAAEGHITIEQSTKDQVDTSDAVAAGTEDIMDTTVDIPVEEPADFALLALENVYAKEVVSPQEPSRTEELEPVENLALGEDPSPIESLVLVDDTVTTPPSTYELVEESAFAEDLAIEEEPKLASSTLAPGVLLRARSASCSGRLKAPVVSLLLSRRASCSGRLPGCVQPFELPSLPPSPGLAQTTSMKHIEEASFPRVERLPTNTEVLEKLDEVLVKINACFTGPCATRTSTPPPPPLLDPSPAPLVPPAPSITQAVEMISPQPAPRPIKAFTARRPPRYGRGR